jgi:hypothetical protein
VEVIKPGKFGTVWAMEVVCTGHGNGNSGCEAVLLVNREDLRYYPGVPGDSWGSRDPAVCFKCPICSSITDVPRKDWPFNYDNLSKWTSAWYKSKSEGIEQ